MLFSYEKNLIFWQLLLYGVHIGHRFRNSSLYAGWLIFTYTYETLIINLYKTILGFKNGNLGYDYCCKVGSPIWFLNLNKAFEIYVNESALKCGEFGYTTYWIHGMISNWLFLADQINKLWHYTEDAYKGQFGKLEMDYSPWFLSRWSWPRAVLISSVHTSEWPSHECLKASIPSVGIVDTNISGHISNIATPGNDDALDAMVYYNTSTSQYILEKKYMTVITWLHHVREMRRRLTFTDWILSNFIKENGRFYRKKIHYIIRERETRDQITDDMRYLLTYKMNIVKYWGLGVKFFFGLDSGNGEFQGGLDLYSQNGEKVNDRFDIYGLMEKLKQKGFYICKLSNFYLLKGLWHSSNSVLVRRKFMSNKWFKFRFLTNNYYPKERLDDYFKTNFLVNRFWRNRIFKTYLRRSFFRNNIFLIKFFKFYNVYRYNNTRGFLDQFSASYMKVSSFSNVAFSYGFNYFKKHFYTPLLSKANSFSNLFRDKKFSFLSKWSFFKKEMGSFLNKIVYSNQYSNDFKFSNIFRLYAKLKNQLRPKIKLIYTYINFYYSFWYWNRSEYRFMKMTRRFNLVRRFRALKNLSKLFIYLDFFNRSVYPLKRFQSLYLNNHIDHTTVDLLTPGFSRVFGLLTLNFRKGFFSSFVNFRNYKINKFRRYFRKLLRKNNKRRNRNYVIHTLQYEYDRFKKTPEVQRKVRRLYRRIQKNVLVNFYNRKYGKNYSPKLSLKRFLYIIRGKDNKLMKDLSLRRFSRYYSTRYNIPGFSFFQASKKLYNKEVFVEITPAVVYKRDIAWDMYDDDDRRLPSYFLQIYSKSNTPTYSNLLTHNIEYFNQVIIKTTFENIFRKSRQLTSSKVFKIMKKLKKSNSRSFIKYYFKKYKFLPAKIKHLLVELRHLRYKYKRHVRRAGSTSFRYVSGFKFFYASNFTRLWSFIKKDYFLNDGFYFKTWNIHFNRNYSMKKKRLMRPSYFSVSNDGIRNYVYFFYIRYYSIFHKYLSILGHRILGNRATLLLRRNRITHYFKDKRKIYWF